MPPRFRFFSMTFQERRRIFVLFPTCCEFIAGEEETTTTLSHWALELNVFITEGSRAFSFLLQQLWEEYKQQQKDGLFSESDKVFCLDCLELFGCNDIVPFPQPVLAILAYHASIAVYSVRPRGVGGGIGDDVGGSSTSSAFVYRDYCMVDITHDLGRLLGCLTPKATYMYTLGVLALAFEWNLDEDFVNCALVPRADKAFEEMTIRNRVSECAKELQDRDIPTALRAFMMERQRQMRFPDSLE